MSTRALFALVIALLIATACSVRWYLQLAGETPSPAPIAAEFGGTASATVLEVPAQSPASHGWNASAGPTSRRLQALRRAGRVVAGAQTTPASNSGSSSCRAERCPETM